MARPLHFNKSKQDLTLRSDRPEKQYALISHSDICGSCVTVYCFDNTLKQYKVGKYD